MLEYLRSIVVELKQNLKTCCLCLNVCKDNVDNVRILTLNCCGIKTKHKNLLFMFSLSIFYLQIKQTKWIRHK